MNFQKISWMLPLIRLLRFSTWGFFPTLAWSTFKFFPHFAKLSLPPLSHSSDHITALGKLPKVCIPTLSIAARQQFLQNLHNFNNLDFLGGAVDLDLESWWMVQCSKRSRIFPYFHCFPHLDKKSGQWRGPTFQEVHLSQVNLLLMWLPPWLPRSHA